MPQSAVSGAVARLREAGSVLAKADPADRRRQLLRRNRQLTPRRRKVAAAGGDHETTGPTEVLAALEILGRRLTPQTITRLREEGPAAG